MFYCSGAGAACALLIVKLLDSKLRRKSSNSRDFLVIKNTVACDTRTVIPWVIRYTVYVMNSVVESDRESGEAWGSVHY